MARAISDTQERAIFTSLPSSVTISGTIINASKLYPNQELTSYPAIRINVSTDGIASPETYDVVSGQLYYESILTIHIKTRKEHSGSNGAVVAKAFASSICSTIAGWTTPLTGDVRIFKPDEDIKSIGYLGYDKEVFDYVISATIYHS